MPQWVRDYLESLRTQNFSPKSIDTYENALDRFLSFLTTLNRERLQDVISSDLESYRLALVEGPLSSASTHLYLRAVRQWFNWLESRHLLFLNPFASVAIPRLDRRLTARSKRGSNQPAP